MTLTVGSLCSGCEGIGLGLTAAGIPHRLLFVADPDKAASAILAARHPGVPNLGDIKVVDWAEIEPPDLLTAGFPCQDVSSAGLRRGIAAGTRSGLWTEVAWAINNLRPRWVLIENVRGLLSARADSDVEPCPWCLGDRGGQDQEPVLRALGAVLGDLSDLGYDARWVTVAASDVGAPHQRQRVFVLAHRPGDDPAETFPIPAAHDRHGDGGLDLRTAVTLPPTPDATHGRKTTRTGPLLAGAVELLPTPMAADAERSSPTMARGNPTLVGALLPTPTAARVGNRVDTQLSGDGREHPNKLGWAVGALLPTPTAHDDGKSPEAHLAMKARMPGGTRTQITSLAVLARAEFQQPLLPTPRASDGTHGGPNQRGSKGDLMLPSAVHLLPTPTAQNSHGNAENNRGDLLLPGVVQALDTFADRWGQFAPAISRWEQVLGRPAPEPTEPGKDGKPRLAPAFVEWMVGLPPGYVTDLILPKTDPRPNRISRNDALRLLGNGVVPQQLAHALRLLAGVSA